MATVVIFMLGTEILLVSSRRRCCVPAAMSGVLDTLGEAAADADDANSNRRNPLCVGLGLTFSDDAWEEVGANKGVASRRDFNRGICRWKIGASVCRRSLTVSRVSTRFDGRLCRVWIVRVLLVARVDRLVC